MGTSNVSFWTKLKNWYSIANMAHAATVFFALVAAFGTLVALDFFVVTRESLVQDQDKITQIQVYPSEPVLTKLSELNLPSDSIKWVTKGDRKYAASPLEIKPEWQFITEMGRSAYERFTDPNPWAKLEPELKMTRLWLITVRIWNKGEIDSGPIEIKLPFAVEEKNIVEMKGFHREDHDKFAIDALPPNGEIELTFEHYSKIDENSINIEAKDIKSPFTNEAVVYAVLFFLLLFTIVLAWLDIRKQNTKSTGY